MASHGKKKTTMAKLNREARLRERRQTKEANKRARQQAPSEPLGDAADSPAPPDAADPTLPSAEPSPTGA